MNLSSEACLVLNNPMKYLHLEHNRKEPLDSSRIWGTLHRRHYQETGELPVEVFVKALKSIRKFASLRGKLGEEKELIHQSILKYSKKVYHKFGSVNQLSNHIKGLYGCELPKKLRDELHDMITNQGADPTPSVDTKEVNIGGMIFTLTTGSSLKIGEMSTESLNLKGMKSIKIERVSEGRLFGVSLEV